MESDILRWRDLAPRLAPASGQGLRIRMGRLQAVWAGLTDHLKKAGLAGNCTPPVASIVRITIPLQERPHYDCHLRHRTLVGTKPAVSILDHFAELADKTANRGESTGSMRSSSSPM